ncbi:MAG TPA: AMP-dependent synthetase/ligase [Candidatus Brocadiia bacterium]|nr:AMP-dependent synthetase/ligase [Candidatus Brocadiia bacterium]
MLTENIPQLLAYQAERLGDKCALRFKSDGLYHPVSWKDYYNIATCAARGLIDVGVEPGDFIGLYSDNRIGWRFSHLATLAAGAVSVPLHDRLSETQARVQLAETNAKVVFVSDQVQADRIAKEADNMPDLRWVVHFDTNLRIAGPYGAISWSALVNRGIHCSRKLHDEQANRQRNVKPDDLATIIYSSGTSGAPKGVMLSHGNLLYGAECVVNTIDMGESDVGLNWLPLSHVFGHQVDHITAIRSGSEVAICESRETFVANLIEARPTMACCVPRIYEKIRNALAELPEAEQAARVKAMSGGRLRWCIAGGAPLPVYLGEYFVERGILLLTGYGMTESSSVMTLNTPDNYKIGSAGRPKVGCEIKIAEDGEILTRGEHVMKGYWKNPQATCETIVDGWLHTGDVGYFDKDGYLFITDRKKDIIVYSSGKKVSPALLEGLLCRSPFIAEALVCGEGRSYLSAIIVPEMQPLREQVKDWGMKFESDEEMLQNSRVVEFMNANVQRCLTNASPWEKVRKFIMRPKVFSVEDGEATLTAKLRRKTIIEHHKKELDALYGSE